MESELKTAILALRIGPSLKHQAEVAARHERRSLAGLIEVLLAERIERQAQATAVLEAQP
jgi:hypothetical protein